jgi:HPt (histidine-containing phosphotransfer) domain-containing protein
LPQSSASITFDMQAMVVDPHQVENALDVVDGLRRVAGNVKLYRSLLTQFVEQQADAVSKISASVEQQDYVLAERLMHTLKGVSGNLGAKTTNEMAAELEISLRNRECSVLACRFASLVHRVGADDGSNPQFFGGRFRGPPSALRCV